MTFNPKYVDNRTVLYTYNIITQEQSRNVYLSEYTVMQILNKFQYIVFNRQAGVPILETN